MTRRFRQTEEERGRLGEAWQDIEESGQAPSLDGRSVREAERDKTRKRRIMPSERRRRGCKISPTLPADLVNELRTLCAELGYVGDDGQGVIASPVIEDLLRLAVEAYERGDVESHEVETTARERRLKWRS